MFQAIRYRGKAARLPTVPTPTVRQALIRAIGLAYGIVSRLYGSCAFTAEKAR